MSYPGHCFFFWRGGKFMEFIVHILSLTNKAGYNWDENHNDPPRHADSTDFLNSLIHRPALMYPCVGIHRRTSLMNFSILFCQCLAYLVLLGWFVRWEASGRITADLLVAASSIWWKIWSRKIQRKRIRRRIKIKVHSNKNFKERKILTKSFVRIYQLHRWSKGHKVKF